jgi:D-glycero-alpha-D-manno-heptose-7-phosphate kinase
MIDLSFIQKWISSHATIVSRAPTRIDLAGGTLDIWPIHLLLGEPATLNLGIDLVAETTLRLIETSDPSQQILLNSKDQKSELYLSWKQLLHTSLPPSVELHGKLLRHFARAQPAVTELLERSGKCLEMSTQAKSPAGAGLGGSSALSISLLGGLHRLFFGEAPLTSIVREELIAIARDIETTVIRVPAGLQDYYGAAFGGLQKLTWKAAHHHREALPSDTLRSLMGRILLFYSGQSRNSGINNWVLFKAFIDGDSAVQERFHGIAKATQTLHGALIKKDWQEAGRAIAQEWNIRRGFAPGISTPEIDQAFEKAFALGASAGKICGAGGGGCFFLWTDEENPQIHQRIVTTLQELGMRHLPFAPIENGLDVTLKSN